MNTSLNEHPGGEFVLYQTEDGQSRIQCQLVDGTIWLSQMQMGELFQRSKKTVSEHLQNIFEEAELQEELVVRNFRTTAARVSTEQMKSIAHERYEVFDTRRRSAEALAADAEDFRMLESLEKQTKGKAK